MASPAIHGFTFAESVRVVLLSARQESRALKHEYVGTEHILMGLLAQPDSGAMTVLASLGVDPAAVRRSLLSVVRPGTAAPPSVDDIPYTTRAKSLLAIATTEARTMGHGYLSTEHLLIAVIAEGKGIGAQVLHQHELTADIVRTAVATHFDSPRTPSSQTAAPPSQARRTRRRQRLVVCFLDLANFSKACDQRDEVEIADMLDDVYGRIVAAMSAVPGRVVKFIGDAALVVFEEADADAGVRAILDLKDAMDPALRDAHWDCPLEARLHCGTVVSGYFGPPGSMRFDVVGRAVNDAARLKGSGVVVSPQARELLSKETRSRL